MKQNPGLFWYWMYGAVSKEGITADLEAMKHAGLGGTYLMPIKGIHEGTQYDGKAQQFNSRMVGDGAFQHRKKQIVWG